MNYWLRSSVKGEKTLLVSHLQLSTGSLPYSSSRLIYRTAQLLVRAHYKVFKDS